MRIALSFYLDGLSLLFTLLISGIGALVVIYVGGYLSGHLHLGRFYLYLLTDVQKKEYNDFCMWRLISAALATATVPLALPELFAALERKEDGI